MPFLTEPLEDDNEGLFGHVCINYEDEIEKHAMIHRR